MISLAPPSASSSASLSVAHLNEVIPAPTCRLRMSADLWVLTWGTTRSGEPQTRTTSLMLLRTKSS